MNLELTSKVAFITGSSSGLGLSIAKQLHQEGCNIILNGRRKAQLDKALENFDERAHAILGDITQYDTCDAIAKKIEKSFGELNILICNVGSGSSVAPGEESLNEWNRVFNLNFFCTINNIQSTKKFV